MIKIYKLLGRKIQDDQKNWTFSDIYNSILVFYLCMNEMGNQLFFVSVL